MFKKEKKAYIINGFLESGKTEFIKYTVSQPYFNMRGRTLLILCEEGENEYESTFLQEHNIDLVLIENEADYTQEFLDTLDKMYKPKRVLIEYNGMWSHKEIALSSSWTLEQQITLIDTTTFGMFYSNMKSKIGDMVRNSELILFNRAQGNPDLTTYKRNIKLVNQSAHIIFEGDEVEIVAMLEEELPYDLSAQVIEITDETYGTWIIDGLENIERYDGKTVTFVAKVLKKDTFDENCFVPIREVMTCCEDDLESLGFMCKYEHARDLQGGSWIKLTAVMKAEYSSEHGEDILMLYAIDVVASDVPEHEIIDLKS